MKTVLRGIVARLSSRKFLATVAAFFAALAAGELYLAVGVALAYIGVIEGLPDMVERIKAAQVKTAKKVAS